MPSAMRRAFVHLTKSLDRRLRNGRARLCACALAPALALLVSSGAGAVAPAPIDAAMPGPVPYGQGLLWKIERAGAKPSYLFGTMHVSYEEIVTLPAPVKQAFDAASSASFEYESSRDASYRWARASYYQNWKTLDAEIGPDLFADVVEMAEAYGISARYLRKFKPWVVVFYLSQPPGVYSSRKDGDDILDDWLQEEAERQGKKVYGLETVEEHVGVFADLSPEILRHIIKSMVQQDRVSMRTELSTIHEEMVQLYLDRETGALLTLDDSLADGAGDDIEQMLEERLLDERNHLMVRRMTPRLKEGNAFVAVGAGHLPGEEGMLNLLAQQGYKLTRVY